MRTGGPRGGGHLLIVLGKKLRDKNKGIGSNNKDDCNVPITCDDGWDNNERPATIRTPKRAAPTLQHNNQQIQTARM